MVEFVGDEDHSESFFFFHSSSFFLQKIAWIWILNRRIIVGIYGWYVGASFGLPRSLFPALLKVHRKPRQHFQEHNQLVMEAGHFFKDGPSGRCIYGCFQK